MKGDAPFTKGGPTRRLASNKTHSKHSVRRIYNRDRKIKHLLANSVVVNLSNRVLNLAETSVLNKGLGFIPSINKLNTEQLQQDIDRFDRRLQIFHFFKNKNTDETVDKPLEPSSCMMPKSTWVPKHTNANITEFCHAVKNDIELLSKNKVHPNLTLKEFRALQELKKEESVTIKPADKGGGIAVLNTSDYILKIEEMLQDNLVYDQVLLDDSKDVKVKADSLLLMLNKEGYITTKQLKYLTDFEVRTPIFYGLPKIHKTNIPLRPVVSQINGPTSMVNLLVDKYLAVAEKSIPNILQDTTAFLRLINENYILRDEDLLVTFDVVGLYTNIPHDEGVELVAEYYVETLSLWSNEEIRPIPVELLTLLMKFILKNCTFTFNNKLYRQKYGTTMGAKFSVKFANIYMHKFLTKFFDSNIFLKPKFLGRLIDDVFTVWSQGEDSLRLLLLKLNNFHTTIKFTMEFSREEVHFLDTVVYRVENRIHTKVYTKPTDKKQFLYFSSCHPIHTLKSIPFAQSIRYIRNTSSNSVLQDSLVVLKQQFLNRGYPKKLVEQELNKCTSISRADTLSYKTSFEKRSKFDKILRGRSFLPLIITYHDQYRNKKINEIITKHWNKLIKSSSVLNNHFSSEFPLVVFKKGTTLGDMLTSSKLHSRWITDPTFLTLLELIESDSDSIPASG